MATYGGAVIAESGPGSAETTTGNLNVTGSDLCLIMWASGETSQGGITLTLEWGPSPPGNNPQEAPTGTFADLDDIGGYVWSTLTYLNDPTADNVPIAVTSNEDHEGLMVGGVFATDADDVVATDYDANSYTSGTSMSATVPNAASGDLIVDFIHYDPGGDPGTAATVGADQTNRADTGASTPYTRGAISTQAGADGGVMSWTVPTTRYAGTIMACRIPGFGGGAPEFDAAVVARVALNVGSQGAKTAASDGAGRLALEAAAADAKTISSIGVGRQAIEATALAAKTTGTTSIGRFSLRSLAATVGGVVINAAITARMALRAIGINAKQSAADGAGRMGSRGASADSKTSTAASTASQATAAAAAASKTSGGQATARFSLRALIDATGGAVVNAAVRASLMLRPISADLDTQLTTSFEVDMSGFDDSFSSPGCTVVRDASAARTGSFGLLHTTTAVDGVRASVVRSGLQQPRGRVITDVWFYIVGSGDAGYEIATEGWTGTRRHLTSFRWIDDTGFTERWQYWNRDTDNWSAVPGAAVSLTRDAWHHAICVIDWSIMEYIELVVDDVVYPMTGIPIEDVANTDAAFMQASMLLWTHEASVLTAYSDDFRLRYSTTAKTTQTDTRAGLATRSIGIGGKIAVTTSRGLLALRSLVVASTTIVVTATIRAGVALRGAAIAAKTMPGYWVGRMTPRGLNVNAKTTATTSVGRLSLRSIVAAVVAGVVSASVRAGIALRQFSTSAKVAGGESSAGIAVRASDVGSKTTATASSGRVSLRALIATALVGAFDASIRASIALRQFGASLKVSGSESVGRTGLRPGAAADKTISATGSGRMSLRSIVASVGGAVYTAVVRASIPLRAIGQSAITKTSAARGRMALRAVDATGTVRGGLGFGRLAIRPSNDGGKTILGVSYNRVAVRGYGVTFVGLPGTISRVVDLSAVFDPRITLTATFDPGVTVPAKGDPV